jgi:DNA-binding Lrp family transcriptional regulator
VNEPAIQLDDLDRRIIDVLTVDARVSNRQIAARLGVTEGTIRGRIRRLEEGGSIRLTAITNIEYFGDAKVVLIGVQAQHSELKTLCRQISEMPGDRLRDHDARGALTSSRSGSSRGSRTSLRSRHRTLALPGAHVETSTRSRPEVRLPRRGSRPRRRHRFLTGASRTLKVLCLLRSPCRERIPSRAAVHGSRRPVERCKRAQRGELQPPHR